jgi:hypothetical protein
MALFNPETKEVQFKIVYCGPAFAGKTTNLQHIHARIDDDRRGDLLSMATSTDRTRFFDYLPIDAVLIKGWHTKFQLYTVPGDCRFHATRQLVLKGADGIVFVADSTPESRAANVESLEITKESLRQNGVEFSDLPWCWQFNKRDVPGALAMEDLTKDLKCIGFPCIEAVASQGFNVFASLNAVAEEVLQRFHAKLADGVPA